MKLRPIQQEALEAVLHSFKLGGTFHLIQEPTGWGKTVFTSALMKEAVLKHNVNCLFLAHLKELIIQTEDKFKQVAPELEFGVYCGSLKRREIKQVTIGTRQTIAPNLEAFKDKISLIIIDEVHLMGPDSQYFEIINYFKAQNCRLKVLGVTATPYRLNTGFIYGEGRVFEDLAHSTTLNQMIDLGYLSKFRYKVTEKPDFSDVKITAGEFNESALSELLQEERHTGSVLKAIEDHAQDRKSILVFAVTIEHGERLAELLKCDCVHSKLKPHDWRFKVDLFKLGLSRILVNVSQLSIGFDHPAIDCVVVARPTMSPALHVQICGRSFRKHLALEQIYKKYLELKHL